MKEPKHMNKTEENLSNTIPFQNLLSEDETEQIKLHSNIVTYHENDVIFKQDTRTSHFMFIQSGLIKIYRENRNNKIKIVKLGIPGELLGLNSVLGEEIFSYSAAALGKTIIQIIDYNVMESVLLNNGQFARALMGSICSDNLGIFKRLISQSQKQLPGRIADIILYFSEDIYHSKNFSFPLTRTELAELAGTTKESLIRTLTEFKNDKIIVLEGKKVEIVSEDIIKTLSRIG
ncbi:MAG: Crp/Fnr family transcriptional regulator [Bacteroidales bacterium]|nr:Crp/Fnr family transcriptional regulator [Bacteroidales bacterium]